VGVSQIRSWNNLSRRRHIYPGQRLAIYVRDTGSIKTSSSGSATPGKMDESRFEQQRLVVARGVTFSSISKRYEVSMNDLLAWNGRTRSIIRPGDVLVIWKPRIGAPETGGR
jgi:LysM repeat protein